MSYLKRAEEILEEVLMLAGRGGKLSGFCIGNTSKVDAAGLFFTPIRNTRQLVAGSVIVYEAHHAEEIAKLVDGRVRYIFVDSEKKTGPDPEAYGPEDYGNIERAVRDVVRYSRVLTYKGNDLTVDSIDCLLVQLMKDPIRGLGGKKVAIIGAGNLGSKLALKLVERGANVVITRRDKGKLEVIVRALNYIKPLQTVATVVGTTDNEEAACEANILIGITNGIPVITPAMIDSVAPDALIMDAGKGCLFPEAIRRAVERGLAVLRVDVRAGFEGQVAMLLEMDRILKGTIGRRDLSGIPIVSGGLLAWENEIVVDNVHHPTTIFGVADGRGDFIRQLSPEQKKNVKVLNELIGCQTAALPK